MRAACASAATGRRRARARIRGPGLPTSSAKLPGCTPKKNISSSAGARAARATLAAIVSRSSAAAGRSSRPADSEPFVKSRFGSPAGA